MPAFSVVLGNCVWGTPSAFVVEGNRAATIKLLMVNMKDVKMDRMVWRMFIAAWFEGLALGRTMCCFRWIVTELSLE